MPYNAMKNRAFVPEEKFMREALSLAEEAFSAGEVPVGAVVVKDGKVIGRGRNRREEHQSVLGHAELEAMEQAAKVLGSWRLTGCTLYVTLEPCPMCAGATVNARVDRIVFGTEDEAMGACGTAVSVTSLKMPLNPNYTADCCVKNARQSCAGSSKPDARNEPKIRPALQTEFPAAMRVSAYDFKIM